MNSSGRRGFLSGIYLLILAWISAVVLSMLALWCTTSPQGALDAPRRFFWNPNSGRPTESPSSVACSKTCCHCTVSSAGVSDAPALDIQ